jgi:uncharacterized membrane protein
MGGPIRLPETTKASLLEFVENRDPEALEVFLNSIVEISEAHSYSGPLPAPEMLVQYDRALPGLAERIVRMAERPHEEMATEQAHRHALERSIVGHSGQYRTTGLWMGFAVAVLSLMAAFYCAIHGYWIGVAGFLCLPIVGVVSVLVTGKPWAQKKPTEDESNDNSDAD